MKEQEKISLGIHGFLLSVYDTISLPTHSTLESTFKLSLVLLLCSVLSTVLKFYTFVSWQGCLLCSGALTILLYLERRENDALLRMYRNARVSAEKVIQRAKTAGISQHSNNGGTTINSPNPETSRE
jgi:hypothetical protein